MQFAAEKGKQSRQHPAATVTIYTVIVTIQRRVTRNADRYLWFRAA
jgi:hypothetical protein